LKESQGSKNLVSTAGLKTVGHRVFSSLGHRAYRLYFFGMLGQFASMNMQMIAGSYLIYHLTGSSALLGSMSLANALPMIVISMFGGAFADRIQKKKILSIGLAFSALISCAIAVALTTGYLSRDREGSWWILLASSFFQGAVMGMVMPSRQSIIPEIVSREHAMNAVALNMLGMNVMRMVAPGVAGFIIGDTYNFDIVYYIMTALNIYAAIAISFVPDTNHVNKKGGNIVADIQQGFKYVLSQKTILFILIFTLFVVILSMPFQQLLPIYVDDILKVGATGQGFLMMATGGGALAGSLVIATLPNKKRGLILLASGLISGISLTIFAFSSIWTLSLTIMIFVGLGMTIRATISNALLQTYTEAPYMGRVLSILMMEWGIVSLCTFAAGVMAEFMPVQWVIGGFAIALIAITILALIFTRRVRNLN
jgi:MFS family permease